ncbi:hypothetical protein PPERSA_00983 [Pseudocohnilembus persalinus]|uniref:Immunoglobulin E-set n=1 Tax=Pseudocohnilembus persalinus TaxID=266149 RepID=A0A0V0R8J1_PSEPJ|nr:hypothetical protein PPERSA_00983 [Pseudocohnilembus persalinus]|eukprot:KRX10813.1 hypothetical protein PPERSA_00983 [Pseudocohnilembus persalinus]
MNSFIWIKNIINKSFIIEVFTDKNQSSDFMSMKRELEPTGTLTEDKTYPFNFQRFEKEIETFHGNTARIRYFVKVSVLKNQQVKTQKVQDVAVYLPTPQIAETQNQIKLEVGIEDCLHIEFEYAKNKFHLKDVITGKVSFMLVRIRIKYMEIHIIKRELQGSGQNQITDNETLVKHEVMDGCPHKGEVIPIRIYLAGIDVTPSSKNVSGKFTVKHFINLVLVDEDDRRYFKQQEITFYRKK